MNHSKAISLRVSYLRGCYSRTENKYNLLHKKSLKAEMKVVQDSGIVFLDKLFVKLKKLGYTYSETKISGEGLYHVWGERAGKRIFGTIDPYGEAVMIMMPTKVVVTHIGIPVGKTYLTTRDTFLAALLHPETNE